MCRVLPSSLDTVARGSRPKAWGERAPAGVVCEGHTPPSPPAPPTPPAAASRETGVQRRPKAQVLPPLSLPKSLPLPMPQVPSCAGGEARLVPEADFCGFEACAGQGNGARASEVPAPGLGAARLTSREGGTQSRSACKPGHRPRTWVLGTQRTISLASLLGQEGEMHEDGRAKTG